MGVFCFYGSGYLSNNEGLYHLVAINSGYHWIVKEIGKCIYIDTDISWWLFPKKLENEARP